MSQTIRIASWNINSVRARIDIVERYLKEEAPDVLCLQETKVIDSLFPEGLFRQLGYRHMVLNGQPMHHGVAIVSKLPLINRRVEDWQANGEARHVGAELNVDAAKGVRIDNVYIPAGGEVPDSEVNSKFGQKLGFLSRMTEWSRAVTSPTILTGDFNVAPLEHDVWSHKQLLDVVSHTPIEVEGLLGWQKAAGWHDALRHFVPEDQKLYTWWSYRARDWRAADRGRRLDHVWVSDDLAGGLKRHLVLKDARDWPQASDHVPVLVEFQP
jgi:exodeoxyribonuclease-3